MLRGGDGRNYGFVASVASRISVRLQFVVGDQSRRMSPQQSREKHRHRVELVDMIRRRVAREAE
jgi:hypothetical protein